jgi:cation diffusion facilitator family transporter
MIMKSVESKAILLGKKNGRISIAGNVILFCIKLWAGLVSGSVALIADAWHTLSDSFSSVIMLAGFRISEKPPDEEHPFGHGRAEIVASLIIGCLLMLVGINFLYESITKIINRESADFGKIAIVVTIISIVVKEAMARYAFHVSKNTGFTSLKADAWHHRSDAVSSLIILVGIFLNPYVWWIDAFLGFLVALIIGYTGLKISKEAFAMLLGETPNKDLKNSIIRISNDYTGRDLQHHHFHVHKYGNHTEVTFHIKLEGDMKLRESHQITRGLTRILEEELNIFATIYVDAL